MPIKSKRKSVPVPFFLFAAFLLFVSPLASAQQKTLSRDRGQEASASQAQATMASLFGRGAKMPSIPHANGTLALPAFDNSGITIDEGALREAQRGGQNS